MNAYFAVGAGLAAAGAVWGAYETGYSAGSDAQIAGQAKVQDLVNQVKVAAVEGAASAISGISVKNTTLMGKVQREVYTNTVYRDCEHTDNGLRLVNEALTNGRPESSPVDGKLPATDAAR